jgi:hypothetical protein
MPYDATCGNSGGRGAVASIIAHEVLGELIEISQSNAPPAERRVKAQNRMALFKTDLLSAHHPLGRTDSLESNLRRLLEEALEDLELPGDELPIFVAALNALTGSED